MRLLLDGAQFRMCVKNNRISGRRFFIVLLCYIGLISSSSLALSQEQAHISVEATIKALSERIMLLEGQIKNLESASQEFNSRSQEGRRGQAKTEDNSALRAELVSLRETIRDLQLSLKMQRKKMTRIQITGEERSRFMNIDTEGKHPTGVYGEALKQETTFKHYLRLNVTALISDRLTAGGRVRISNVSRKALDSGPEYLSQEWGSAFLKYSTKNTNTTVGCYDIHLTPLTLMRWDLEDNPEGGGIAGGGCLPCGEVAGAIPSESLEELSPTLSFEGARFNVMIGDHVDGLAFYARLREEEWTRYRRHIVGFRTKLIPYQPLSPTPPHLGVALLRTGDEARSVEFPPLNPPLASNVLNADAHFPITRSFVLRGEWAHAQVVEDSLVGGKHTYEGSAFLVGFKTNYPSYFKLRCSYLLLNRSFDSFYRALSYSANRRGFRASSTLEIPGWKSSVSTFIKILKEIYPTEVDVGEDFLQTFYTASIGASVSPIKDLIIRPSLIYRGTRRDEDLTTSYTEKVKDDTFIFINEIVLTLFRDNQFILRYQYIDFKDKINSVNDSGAETIFTLFNINF
jgi:hypothetical protein